MVTIIDASIAVKWFVTEADSDKALNVLSELLAEPENFAVPELFFYELTNVLSIIAKDMPKEGMELVNELFLIGWERFVMTATLYELTKKYQRLGLSGYDASYLALAEQLNGIWLTADKKAVSKLISVEGRVRLL